MQQVTPLWPSILIKFGPGFQKHTEGTTTKSLDLIATEVLASQQLNYGL